jgi:hypothetical protein
MDTTGTLETVDHDLRCIGGTVNEAVPPFCVNFSDAELPETPRRMTTTRRIF